MVVTVSACFIKWSGALSAKNYRIGVLLIFFALFNDTFRSMGKASASKLLYAILMCSKDFSSA